jgi:protein TonB
MFTKLVESKPGSRKGNGGTAVSFVAHYGLILVVLYTSAEARAVDDGPRQEKLTFIEPKTVEPAPKKESTPELFAAPLPMKVAPTLTAPIDIPNVLPEIDLTRAPTDPAQFTGKHVSVARPGSESGLEPAPRPDNTYLEFEVDKPVSQAPNSAVPAYPDILRQAGVEGEALVSFVVDTTGRVDVATFRVIRTTHDLFGVAVKNALPRMRFIPAETSRGKVRQVVQQPFSFAIVK